MKENQRMSTYNRLDLQTLESQPIRMPKNLPEHRSEGVARTKASHSFCHGDFPIPKTVS